MQASPGDEQAPLQSGASASPHGVGRHSQEAPLTVVPHFCPPGQVPSQRPSRKWHPDKFGSVVELVLRGPGVTVAGKQSMFCDLTATLRLPNSSSTCAEPTNGSGHFAG